jgi:hypothetical protein
MKKVFAISFLTFIFSGIIFQPGIVLGQVEPPKTIEEAKGFGFEILRKLPEAVKEVWNSQALPILKRMWEWAQGPLETYIKPKAQEIINWLKNLLGKEIEERTPIIKEEFKKESIEMINDAPSVLERFKNLLK